MQYKAWPRPILGVTYKSYQAYLDSSLWKLIRNRVMVRDGERCRACYETANLQVHHRSYEDAVLAGRADGQLVTLCASCHHSITAGAENFSGRRMERERLAEAALMNRMADAHNATRSLEQWGRSLGVTRFVRERVLDFTRGEIRAESDASPARRPSKATEASNAA